jgi:hypothetical protein
MSCSEESLTFYIYGELEPTERQAVEAHTKECATCRERLAALERLRAVMDQRTLFEPAPEQLMRSRLRLEEALDADQVGWRSLVSDWLPLLPGALPSRLAATVLLLALGFGFGWILRPRARSLPNASGGSLQAPRAGSLVGPSFDQISSITQVQPEPQTEQVRITLNAEHHVTLEGSLDDPRIRNILVDAVKRYDNAGIRLDTLEALQQGSNDPSVQDALLYALERDPNAGVRLQALRYVQQMAWSAKVQKALVDVARDDQNPGVRVAAINSLVSHALAQREQSLIPVLENFSQKDPNNYIRMRALVAVHELAAGQP